MYSNYSFQFLEISSVFLSYHNGNTNISIAFSNTALGAVSPIGRFPPFEIIKLLLLGNNDSV